MTQLLSRPAATAAPTPATATRLTRPRRIPTHLTLLLVCGLWTVPVLGLLVSSFRPAYEVSTTGWWRAGEGTLTTGNYRDVLTTGGFGTALANSLLITVPAVAAMVTVGAVGAFALARMSFAGRRAVTVAMIALLALPLQMTLVPVLRLYNAAGLTGTFAGIWLVHLGFGLPFAIYLLRTFFAALPDEMFEAAALDGASTLTAFLRLAVPVSGPAIASVATFQFIWVWNDLLIALIFLGGDPGVAPLTVAVSNLVSATTGQGWQLLTAAAFVAMVVPMVIFFALQRYFVRGLLAGSGK